MSALAALPAARLSAVGVIGLVPTVLAYRPYPAMPAARPAAERPVNQAIHATAGYQRPYYRH